VHDAVAHGTVRIVHAVYALGTGRVAFWNVAGLQ